MAGSTGSEEHTSVDEDRASTEGRVADEKRGDGLEDRDSGNGARIPSQSADEPGSEREAPAGPAAARPARGRAPRTRRGRVALVVSFVGELLITVGVVLGLFVAYSLWWTNVVADREANSKGDRVREQWRQDDGGDKDTGPGALDTEDGIGFLHVPTMSGDDILVQKGTSPDVLNHGVAGYYTKPVKSALPWDRKGNFALAAHRDGHGAEFHNIHKVKKDDAIVFETKDVWYVYKVYATLPSTSKYNVDVLDKVPKESGRSKPGRYITLTTCTPLYTSTYRYIVWGELVRTEKADSDRTPPKEIR